MTTDHRAIVEQLGELLAAMEPYDLPLEFVCEYATCDGGWEGYTTNVEPRYHALLCGAVNALPALLTRLERLEAVAEAAKACMDAVPIHRFTCSEKQVALGKLLTDAIAALEVTNA